MCGVWNGWAASLLIGFVAIGAENEAVFLDPLIVGIKLEAVFGPMRLPECVAVVKFSVYEECHPLSFNGRLEHIEDHSRQNNGRSSLLSGPEIGSVIGLAEEIERLTTGTVNGAASVFEAISGGLSVVLEGDSDVGLPFLVGIKNPNVFNADICPELPRGILVSVGDEARGSEPQHPSNYAKQPLARLDPEDRSLGSVLATLLAIMVASAAYWRGWRAVGCVLAAYGIFGLLLRLDLWSLAVRVM